MRVDDAVIRAAGGIVARGAEILVVHRPKYDDWSLPKGKCNAGESDEACALREVEEETGLRCEIVRPLGESQYDVAAGPKVVRWFLMRPVGGEFTPHDEVDGLGWGPRATVARTVTVPVGVEQLADV